MPELPRQLRERLLGLGLSQYDVLVLSDDAEVAAYFDAVLAAGAPAKPAANWVMGDVMAHCKEVRLGWEQLAARMAPAALAEMISLIEDGTISGKIGKDVLPALLAGEGGAGGGSVRALVEARGLVQISDPAALAAIVDGVLAANSKQLQAYREGEAAPCQGNVAAAQHRPNQAGCCEEGCLKLVANPICCRQDQAAGLLCGRCDEGVQGARQPQRAQPHPHAAAGCAALVKQRRCLPFPAQCMAPEVSASP